MSDPKPLPWTNASWRTALLRHAAHILAEGRDLHIIAYFVPDGNGNVEEVLEVLYADELPACAVVVPLLSGPIERCLWAIRWPDCDRNTGEVLGDPVVADPELGRELERYADRLWQAWRNARMRRQPDEY